MDDKTKRDVQRIPLLKVRAGPRDEAWLTRLAEEYSALIKVLITSALAGAEFPEHLSYIQNNKESDSDWFKIESDASGLKWTGTCWYVHDLLKYEFKLEFEIPATYPAAPPELKLPELDGKTPKMYRGGIICTTDHFKPLWSKNVPHFGLAHALALGLAPWLAVEIPDLIASGRLLYKDGSSAPLSA